MRDSVLDRIQDLTEEFTPRLVDIRRHLHAHPELSGHEQQTAAYVAGVLYSLGLKVEESVGRTGLVADLPGQGQDDRILAIRTDMDGLPILEQTGLPFASKYPGIMHACGHDIHATVGLGVAMVLSKLGVLLPGTVRFLFQPAEEITQGARWMIEAGAITGVSHILGVHTFPSIPAGSIGVRAGTLTAAADDFTLTILGESGHGARPHEAVDSIWIAAQVITTLQQAISRTQNPLRPVVLTIGKIEGGRAINVIADRVTLMGTARCLDPQTHDTLPGWIETMVANICQTFGATYEMSYKRGAPPVHNDLHLNQLLEQSFVDMMGSKGVQHLADPSLGAEDFGVYLEHLPGAMFRLGVGHGDSRQRDYTLHHPKFNADERSIPVGVMTLARAAYRYWQDLEP